MSYIIRLEWSDTTKNTKSASPFRTKEAAIKAAKNELGDLRVKRVTILKEISLVERETPPFKVTDIK